MTRSPRLAFRVALAYATCVLLLATMVVPATKSQSEDSKTSAFPDLRDTPPDLTVPPMTLGVAAPGRRVRQTSPGFEGTNIYHALYLPADWKKGERYPVIVEYAGNGPYTSEFGDVSSGHLEGSKLGFGISGGNHFIWVCLPFVNSEERRNQTLWWGDTEATVRYCETAVRSVCEEYGGDPSRVILAGFSRGAIACNYIGLHDDEIADMWLAFIPYSHYDGVRRWDWPGSDRESALERLKRLRGRASFVCQERSVEDERAYIDSTGIIAPFTFLAVPFRNHNDAWTLRDSPARKALRSWVEEILKTQPGTHAIRGRIRSADGKPLAHVRIGSGNFHFTYTDDTGRFVLAGLIDSRRTVTPSENGKVFTPRNVTVEIRGQDINGLAFTSSR